MSADYFLLYYGIRLPADHDNPAEFEAYETETHPHQAAARAAGLDTWWDNFGEGERYYLFVGAELGAFGREDGTELRLDDGRILEVMRDTKEKLRAAGFGEAPALLAQFAPDH